LHSVGVQVGIARGEDVRIVVPHLDQPTLATVETHAGLVLDGVWSAFIVDPDERYTVLAVGCGPLRAMQMDVRIDGALLGSLSVGKQDDFEAWQRLIGMIFAPLDVLLCGSVVEGGEWMASTECL